MAKIEDLKVGQVWQQSGGPKIVIKRIDIHNSKVDWEFYGIPKGSVEHGSYDSTGDVEWRDVNPRVESTYSEFEEYLETAFLVDDDYHVLLSAAVDRNILVYDSDAEAGQFTKRLVSLMKTVMRRNDG